MQTQYSPMCSAAWLEPQVLRQEEHKDGSTVEMTTTCFKDRKCVEAWARKKIQSLPAARCASRLQSRGRPCWAQNASSSVHCRAARDLASLYTAVLHENSRGLHRSQPDAARLAGVTQELMLTLVCALALERMRF